MGLQKLKGRPREILSFSAAIYDNSLYFVLLISIYSIRLSVGYATKDIDVYIIFFVSFIFFFPDFFLFNSSF